MGGKDSNKKNGEMKVGQAEDINKNIEDKMKVTKGEDDNENNEDNKIYRGEDDIKNNDATLPTGPTQQETDSKDREQRQAMLLSGPPSDSSNGTSTMARCQRREQPSWILSKERPGCWEKNEGKDAVMEMCIESDENSGNDGQTWDKELGGRKKYSSNKYSEAESGGQDCQRGDLESSRVDNQQQDEKGFAFGGNRGASGSSHPQIGSILPQESQEYEHADKKKKMEESYGGRVTRSKTAADRNVKDSDSS